MNAPAIDVMDDGQVVGVIVDGISLAKLELKLQNGSSPCTVFC